MTPETLPGTCEPAQKNRAGTGRSCATSAPHIPETRPRTRQEKHSCNPGENRGSSRENGERKRYRRPEMCHDVRSPRRAKEVRGNPSRNPERETFRAASELQDSAVDRGTFTRLEKKKTIDCNSGDPSIKINPPTGTGSTH